MHKTFDQPYPMAEILYHAKVWEMSRDEAMLLCLAIGMEVGASSDKRRSWAVGDHNGYLWGTWMEPGNPLKVWCKIPLATDGSGFWCDILESDFPKRIKHGSGPTSSAKEVGKKRKKTRK